MSVGAVATLLVESLSVATVVDTLTVLVTVWLAGVVLLTLTLSVSIPEPPATREAMPVHVRLPPDAATGHPEPAFARTNEVPAASVSESEMALGASLGPLLVATIV